MVTGIETISHSHFSDRPSESPCREYVQAQHDLSLSLSLSLTHTNLKITIFLLVLEGEDRGRRREKGVSEYGGAEKEGEKRDDTGRAGGDESEGQNGRTGRVKEEHRSSEREKPSIIYLETVAVV